mmetsp:Transcript_11885/g.19347  ORF Transcript_11885/g.19347 Transcript_11885/m.19347 type:complete len:297 (+) Transcript_11885:62-952(+)
MFVLSLFLIVSVVAALQASPKPGFSAEQRALSDYKSLHGKRGPVAPQLAAFNDLDYHAHNRFYAKSMDYNEVVLAATDVGPFNVSFYCTSTLIQAFIGIQNDFSYPVTFHGNFLSGADTGAVNLLNAGQGVVLKVAEFDGTTRVGAPASKGAVFLSNGYFLGLSNADSYLMTLSTDDNDDRMPNSDCTVAGFLEFAHPKGGKYYDGFLYEDVLLQQASDMSSSPSSASLAGGVFLGMIMGAAVVVVTTLLVTKNRSLLLHAVGYYDSMAAQCTSVAMEDTSTSGLTNTADLSVSNS